MATPVLSYNFEEISAQCDLYLIYSDSGYIGTRGRGLWVSKTLNKSKHSVGANFGRHQQEQMLVLVENSERRHASVTEQATNNE